MISTLSSPHTHADIVDVERSEFWDVTSENSVKWGSPGKRLEKELLENLGRKTIHWSRKGRFITAPSKGARSEVAAGNRLKFPHCAQLGQKELSMVKDTRP